MTRSLRFLGSPTTLSPLTSQELSSEQHLLQANSNPLYNSINISARHMSIQDYKQLLMDKEREFCDLNEQFAYLDEQSNIIIKQLQEQLKEMKRRNEQLQREVAGMKEKRKYFNSAVEREIDFAKKDRNQFKHKFTEFEKKVIELEIVNESLESELRSTKSMLTEYESRTEKTMEELAVLQIQLEETKSNNQEQISVMLSQLKETEDELFALHHVRNKGEHRESREGQTAHLTSSHIAISSELTANNNSHLFRETIKGIRQYMGSLDCRKLEARRMLLRS